MALFPFDVRGGEGGSGLHHTNFAGHNTTAWPHSHHRPLASCPLCFPPLHLVNYRVLCAQSFSRVQLFLPVDCSLLGSSVHGILQARILGWVAMPFSRGSS